MLEKSDLLARVRASLDRSGLGVVTVSVQEEGSVLLTGQNVERETQTLALARTTVGVKSASFQDEQ